MQCVVRFKISQSNIDKVLTLSVAIPIEKAGWFFICVEPAGTKI